MLKGLTDDEVKNQILKYGYNELPASKSKNTWIIAVEVIKEPMFLLLISCSLIYILIGDYKEGFILLSTILLIIFITFYQYQKTEKALEALKELSSPRALVLRNGNKIRIPSREVVIDDIIILNEGDRIVADAILIDSTNITIDESLLTGESLAVVKNPESKDSEKNRIYAGTLVVQGKGIAKVTAIGINTQFGKIGNSLNKIKEEDTRLQKEMKLLINILFIISASISILVFTAFFITRGNFTSSLLNALTSAMAILPEEFPVVLTIFLAIGAWRLSKKNVLTRKPSAIETLGSTTVLCSDKTGTITQNKMEIVSIYYQNKIFNKTDLKNNASSISEIVKISLMASNKNPIDPMEKGIVKLYETFSTGKINEYNLIKEFPISKDLLAMTFITEDMKNKEIHISSKGAPETIFELCHLDQDEKEEKMMVFRKFAEKGYRVIGVAKSSSKLDKIPNDQRELSFEFIGLLAFEDPIRPEIPSAIRECYDAGIKVIMITGDYPITAKSISTKIGMNPLGEIISGVDLEKLSDKELKKKINDITIFARVVPDQKLRIVNALKSNNEIVTMTGDGVNDAPALKAANIGVSMGLKGTDVAREASSLVLLDDNFASIVAAIRSGRKIFDNLQKAMSYIIAIHIPIIGLTLIPAFYTTIPILLMPLHIVFLELIIDPISSIAFEYQQEEIGIMQIPPRKSTEKFFGGKKIGESIFQGSMLLISVLSIYLVTFNENHSEKEIRAITFSTLIIGNIFLILSNLSKTKSFLSVIKEKNVAAIFISILALVFLFTIIYVPYLQTIFNFENPGLKHFIYSLITSILMLFILEIIKLIKRQKIIRH